MSTYSLTLRQDVGRKLTIQELDHNFLYLEDLTSEGGGSVNLPKGYVVIGGGLTGSATGSESFTFDSTKQKKNVEQICKS